MPIDTEKALYWTNLRIASTRRGFAPYRVIVKPSGVYLEGVGPNVLHASLHTRACQNDPGASECHITISRESRSRVKTTGFEGPNLWRWKREIAERDHDVKRALSLVFPDQFAVERFGLARLPAQPRTIVLDPVVKARRVDVWFGRSETTLCSYLQRFSSLLHVVDVSDEVVAFTDQVERTRDYRTFQPSAGFGSFTLGTGDPYYQKEDEYTQIFIGHLGEHARELVHGSLLRVEVDNAGGAA